MKWKIERPLYWMIVDIVIGIWILTSLIVSIIEVSSLGFNEGIISDVSNNFKVKPLFQLTTTNDGICAGDMEKYAFGNWPGLVEGCNCINGYSSLIPKSCWKSVCRESCSPNMTSHGCIELKQVLPEPIYQWHNTLFCGLQHTQTKIYKDYLENAVKKEGKCKQGFKKCGILDSLDQIMCLEEEKECPINDLLINKKEALDESYTSIPLIDGYYLHFSNQKTYNKIVTNTTVIENQICIDPTQTDRHSLYLLDKHYNDNHCSNKIGGLLYNSRYNKIDSSPKITVFTNNNLMNYYRRDPKFNDSLFKRDMNLYTNNYIGLDYKCLIKTKFDFNAIDQHLASLNIGHSLDIAVCTFVSIQFVMFILFSYYRIKKGYDLQLTDNIFMFIQMGIALIQLILAIVSLSKFRTIDMKFNCGDYITNTAMNQIQAIFDRAVIFNEIILGVGLLIIILYPSDFLLDLLADFSCCRKFGSFPIENNPKYNTPQLITETNNSDLTEKPANPGQIQMCSDIEAPLQANYQSNQNSVVNNQDGNETNIIEPFISGGYVQNQ